jgi:hypothetical protein
VTVDDQMLDGNAAAGLLSEVFALDATGAIVTCAACGAHGALATAHVYMSGIGTVIRCPACSAALMRLARIRGELRADLRGVGLLAQAGGAATSSSPH